MDPVRLPRFKRSPAIAPMRLTDRDREILRCIDRHRFLRSDHLTSLLPGSRQQTLRRLQLLYHHGYLERPRCQIEYYHRGGSRSIAYGIGNKGAGLLKRELSLPFHRLDWPRKNAVQRLFLEHALLVSDVMVALELACSKRPDVRLLTTDDLPAEATKKREPFQWKVDIGNGRVCGVIPDRVFGLELMNRPRGQNRIWFCLEADRGTMPVIRSDLDRSSFQRKMLAYEATWTQKIPQSRFAWHRFRVLTVTSSSERLTCMLDACRALKRGQGLFLFADTESFRSHSDVLSLSWQSSRENGMATLLD